MIRYVFKDQPLTIKNAKRADPQKIGTALEKITAANNGKLTPKATVEAARATSNVLHKHFEWDDAIAAESFRIDQARGLIRCIDIAAPNEEEAPQPAFISIAERSEGVSYRRINDVLESVDLQLVALRQAERDMAAYESRLRMFQDLCSAIREVRERIAERRSTMEGHRATRA